ASRSGIRLHPSKKTGGRNNMRAWQVSKLGDPREALRLVELPKPIPAAGEVLVRVAAAALKVIEMVLCQGKYQEKPSMPLMTGAGEVLMRIEAATLNLLDILLCQG